MKKINEMRIKTEMYWKEDENNNGKKTRILFFYLMIS